MPQPRSRKEVVVLSRLIIAAPLPSLSPGPSSSSLPSSSSSSAPSGVRASRNSSSFASASESSNQTVPMSEGLVAWLESSVVYRLSQL